MQTNIWRTVLIAVLCGYIIFLGATNQLGLYVHPRYHMFTLIVSGIGAAVMIVDFVRQLRTIKIATAAAARRNLVPRVRVSTLLFIGVVVVIVSLPPKTLSTHLALQREGASGNTASECVVPEAEERPQSLNQWASLIDSCAQNSSLEGMAVEVTGFVGSAPVDRYKDDVFTVNRFVMSCCVADSTPVRLPVKQLGWRIDFQEGQWVRVKGTLRREVTYGAYAYILTSATATRIEKPSQPYEFYGQ